MTTWSRRTPRAIAAASQPDEARALPRCCARPRSGGTAVTSATPEPVELRRRLRRKVMGFVVERIAEQRLLWHMRKATRSARTFPPI